MARKLITLAAVVGTLGSMAAVALAAGATATVSPKAAKEGQIFAITVRGMRPREAVTATEVLPFGQKRTVRSRVGRTGTLIVKVRGQVVGTHRWCFKGNRSRRRACTSYKVLKR